MIWADCSLWPICRATFSASASSGGSAAGSAAGGGVIEAMTDETSGVGFTAGRGSFTAWSSVMIVGASVAGSSGHVVASGL